MTLTRAWGLLIALSIASTAVAAFGLEGRYLAMIVLPLAWLKAQIILNRYLGLAQVPDIARGFALSLGVFMLILIGLAIAAG
jgi:cytochrome c oxidase subunit IV